MSNNISIFKQIKLHKRQLIKYFEITKFKNICKNDSDVAIEIINKNNKLIEKAIQSKNFNFTNVK